MYQKHDATHLENRNQAQAQGHKTYYGPPCKWQHDGRRFVSNTVCVTCARIKARDRYRNKPKAEQQDQITAATRWRQSNPERSLWHGAKSRACRRGREFTITPEDITIPEVCPVFGTPMVSPSLDRIKNDKGYVPGNIAVISERANRLKSDATIEELEQILAYMKSNTS